MFDLLFTC